MDLIEKPVDIHIISVPVRDAVCKLRPVLYQWRDYLLLTEISGGSLQESQMKHDTFKIQDMLQIRLDTMEDSGVHDQNIAPFYPEDFTIQT